MLARGVRHDVDSGQTPISRVSTNTFVYHNGLSSQRLEIDMILLPLGMNAAKLSLEDLSISRIRTKRTIFCLFYVSFKTLKRVGPAG